MKCVYCVFKRPRAWCSVLVLDCDITKQEISDAVMECRCDDARRAKLAEAEIEEEESHV